MKMASEIETRNEKYYFPSHATIKYSEIAWKSFWESRESLSLYPYINRMALYLQGNSCNEVKLSINPILRTTICFLSLLFRAYIKYFHSFRKTIFESDILLVGECIADPEIKMMTQLVDGLLKSGKTITYIVRFDSDEYRSLKDFVQSYNFENKVTFIDAWYKNDIKVSVFLYAWGCSKAEKIWKKIKSIFPENIYLPEGNENIVREVAKTQICWEILKDNLKFKTIIIRNHFRPLSATIAAKYFFEEQDVITFQHGVASFPSSGFVPILANKIICFGSQSCNLLRSLNNKHASSFNTKLECSQYVAAGSLIDEISLNANNFNLSTLLILDQESSAAAKFYGIKNEFECLNLLVKELLVKTKYLKKVLIRPHRNNDNLDDWINLIEEFPGKVEISHPNISLKTDLARSSIALGLFSGSMATSSACGLPTIFLWNPDWFYTPDLSCFKRNFMSPENAISKIESLLCDESFYLRERDVSLECASKYYLHGNSCSFDQKFIVNLLQPTCS